MKRIWIARVAGVFVLGALGISLSGPVAAEESGLSETLVGDSTPLTLKVGDLTGAWRLVNINGETAAPPLEAASADQALNSLRDFIRNVGGAPDMYFTQGRLVTAGSESFLVAYRMQYSDQDFNDFLNDYRHGHRENPLPPGTPTIGTLPADTVSSFVLNRTLKLVLLNVRRIGSVMEVRAYNLDSAIAAAETKSDAASSAPLSITPAPSVTVAPNGMAAAPPLPSPAAQPATAPPTVNPMPVAPPSPVAPSAPTPPVVAPPPVHHPAQVVPHAVAVNDLRHIGDALQMYILDHDGTLPPMADAKTAFNALFADPTVFGEGENEPALVPNPVLSEHKLAHIVNPREFVAFYETTPAPDGTRGVLFLDNRVATVNALDWAHFKKASKMP